MSVCKTSSLLQTSDYSQEADLRMGEKENGSILLKNTTAVEVDTFLKKDGLISAL